MTTTEYDASLLERIAAALERLSPPEAAAPDFSAVQAFVWMADGGRFVPVPQVNRVPLGLLKGIDRTAETLLENTRRFAKGLPANNALLWGARGMGKSSLVKAAHAEVASSGGRLDGGESPRATIKPPGEERCGAGWPACRWPARCRRRRDKCCPDA